MCRPIETNLMGALEGNKRGLDYVVYSIWPNMDEWTLFTLSTKTTLLCVHLSLVLLCLWVPYMYVLCLWWGLQLANLLVQARVEDLGIINTIHPHFALALPAPATSRSTESLSLSLSLSLWDSAGWLNKLKYRVLRHNWVWNGKVQK